MNQEPEYRVGSLIVYRPFAGSDRTVRIESKEADIKNGRPGFDGHDVTLPEGEGAVWGYDSQILMVVKY
jgi:hypothetical protein